MNFDHQLVKETMNCRQGITTYLSVYLLGRLQMAIDSSTWSKEFYRVLHCTTNFAKALDFLGSANCERIYLSTIWLSGCTSTILLKTNEYPLISANVCCSIMKEEAFVVIYNFIAVCGNCFFMMMMGTNISGAIFVAVYIIYN